MGQKVGAAVPSLLVLIWTVITNPKPNLNTNNNNNTNSKPKSNPNKNPNPSHSPNRFWLSRYRTDTLSSYCCSVDSSLKITQNSLPHCTGSSSGNSVTHLNKILFLPKTPYLPSTKHNIKVTETRVPLNATMAPHGYMITVYHITNIFYKYRRCMNFDRVSQRQVLFIVTGYALLLILFCC